MEDEDVELPSKPILRINEVSSLLDLQTELIKRKQATSSQTNTYSENYVHRSKNNILSITKQEKQAKQELTANRQARIRMNEQSLRKEEAEREKQRRILEHKALVYDKMTFAGTSLMSEDGQAPEFLVDFNAKKRELEERTTRENTLEEDSNEKNEAPSIINPLIVHYDHTEEKGRVFGASHVPLPFLDEDARQKKISELKQMTEETKIERAKRKKIRSEKKAENRRRLNRLRALKGLPLLESSSDEEEPEPSNMESGQVDATSSSAAEKSLTEELLEPEKKKPKMREWDRGKTGYIKWISARRDEREDEFRPPESYYTNN